MIRNRTEQPRIASDNIYALAEDEIFVFGSNLAGQHMGGAARAANTKFGAEWGVGVGLTGQCYAIPTMQGGIETIKPYVDEFITFARNRQDLRFLVTRIGCGIAGFGDEEIAPLFRQAVSIPNIYLPQAFYDLIVAPYLSHCYYYGKDIPRDRGAQIGHNYEEYWVQYHLNGDDYLLNETIWYIRKGLGDFCSDDGVPMGMKAILFNRFCYWGWGETADTFRRWYESIDYTNTTRRGETTYRKPRTAYNPLLISAILGDIAGSIYEFAPHKSVAVSLAEDAMDYTDDTIMTIAVADWILNDKSLTREGLIACMQRWGRKYPHPMGAYGNMFAQWLRTNHPTPYHSWGNGSAMRVAAVGFAFDTLDQTLAVARLTAEVTHNHPEGIKGAEATAAAIFMARTGATKDEIRRYISTSYGYDLDRTCDDIRPTYCFDASCQGTVPESIIAFMDSTDYEDALRRCISLGGDADTMGAITGAIAGAYYHQIPYDLYEFGMDKLPEDIKAVVRKFDAEYDRCVSEQWQSPEYDAEALIQKVRSGEILY